MTEAPGTHNPQFLPPGIPVPQDDGAARHLVGAKLPDLALPATDGALVNLSRLRGRTVIYIYPRTGVPGVDPPTGWDQIPGARGCTPQSCAFRDHFGELTRLGVAHLYGLSTQDTAYQREAATRLHLPFALLSDEKLALTNTLKLPTFSVVGMHEIAEYGIAAHALYKDNAGSPTELLSRESTAYAWLRRTIELLAEGSNPEEFLEHTKLELFHDQVFCFTPKGKLIALPRKATPIDFAYAVHTDVGNTAVGCKINGQIAPLTSELVNGDEVEIATSKSQHAYPRRCAGGQA